MNPKIIGIGIAIAVIIGIAAFLSVPNEGSHQVTVVQNSTLPAPQGKHLQVSLDESVGIKTK